MLVELLERSCQLIGGSVRAKVVAEREGAVVGGTAGLLQRGRLRRVHQHALEVEGQAQQPQVGRRAHFHPLDRADDALKSAVVLQRGRVGHRVRREARWRLPACLPADQIEHAGQHAQSLCLWHGDVRRHGEVRHIGHCRKCQKLLIVRGKVEMQLRRFVVDDLPRQLVIRHQRGILEVDPEAPRQRRRRQAKHTAAKKLADEARFLVL